MSEVGTCKVCSFEMPAKRMVFGHCSACADRLLREYSDREWLDERGLAAAHRAGAIEALDALRKRFTTAWECAPYNFYSHSSGFREIHESAYRCAIAEINNEIARYAEPEEEKKG